MQKKKAKLLLFTGLTGLFNVAVASAQNLPFHVPLKDTLTPPKNYCHHWRIELKGTVATEKLSTCDSKNSPDKNTEKSVAPTTTNQPSRNTATSKPQPATTSTTNNVKVPKDGSANQSNTALKLTDATEPVQKKPTAEIVPAKKPEISATPVITDKVPKIIGWGEPNPLLNSIAGKLTLKIDLGYAQNFATNWMNHNSNFINKANGSFAYGASLGWYHVSGFGLSTDYLGFGNNWMIANTNYNINYHIITLTPSYRFAFGDHNEWGLKFGLGLGVNIANAELTNNYQSNNPNSIINLNPTSTNNTFGGIVAPMVAVEYDNGLLHADFNLRYLHQLNDVNYQTAAANYKQSAAPLAAYIGFGIGVNF